MCSILLTDRYTVREMKLQWMASKEVEVSHEIPLAKFKLDDIITGDCNTNFSTGKVRTIKSCFACVKIVICSILSIQSYIVYSFIFQEIIHVYLQNLFSHESLATILYKFTFPVL